MAVEALAEPLLSRDHGDSSTAAGVVAGAPHFRRQATNLALAAAAATVEPPVATSGALTSEGSAVARTPPEPPAPPLACLGAAGPAASGAAPISLSDVVAGPSSPASVAPHRAASPSDANGFVYKSTADTLRPAGPPASPDNITPTPTGDASPSRLNLRGRNRNSPRSGEDDDIIAEFESLAVGGDPPVQSTSHIAVEHSRGGTAPTRRGRSSFRIPRGTRHTRRRPVPRSKKASQTDTWSKESFMYACVLMLFAGLTAYLGTMFDGWSSYLRGTFIIIFGVATGFACTGAMALVSETPDLRPRHFSHIVSRLTFIVVSLAFEAAVFYLLGEIGFIAWLFVAAGTIFGMVHFWRSGHPDSLATFVSALCFIPCSLYKIMVGLFRRA